jgi:1,4-alpha-glucan branching enzyme
MWLRDYHIDGLRLDAIHALIVTSATHFLEQLSSEMRQLETELGDTCSSSRRVISTILVSSDPPTRVATAWMHSGVMIFTTRCTQRSPENGRDTTRTSEG